MWMPGDETRKDGVCVPHTKPRSALITSCRRDSSGCRLIVSPISAGIVLVHLHSLVLLLSHHGGHSFPSTPDMSSLAAARLLQISSRASHLCLYRSLLKCSLLKCSRFLLHVRRLLPAHSTRHHRLVCHHTCTPIFSALSLLTRM